MSVKSVSQVKLVSEAEGSEKNLGKSKSSKIRTDKSDDPSALKQQITLLTEELEESRKKFTDELEELRKKLSKIQNEKTKTNRECKEKINILANEKMILQEEVTGLKESFDRKVSMNEKEMKKHSEMGAKKVAKLETDLRETKARLESERRVSSQLLENQELLMVEISKKDTERKTLRNYNELLQ